MKKEKKILIAIIGVLIVSALIIFGINELSKYKTYSAKITQIEGKRIIIRDSDNIEYQLYTNDIKINNTDGKIIDVSNLNIGDNIKIIIKDEIKRDIAMTPKLLQNVKLIKVLEKNLDNVKQDTTKNENNKASTTIKAVVVNAEKGLLVMGIENTGDLYDVNYENKDNIKFKQGQEILIYFNGGMLETYPAQIINVEKIEILKEKSDIKIPDDILRFCYNSRNKVNVSVSELTRTGIEIIIKDTNELQYEYSNSYKINKKVKNKDYTGVGYQIGENTGNSTAGFTRYRT